MTKQTQALPNENNRKTIIKTVFLTTIAVVSLLFFYETFKDSGQQDILILDKTSVLGSVGEMAVTERILPLINEFATAKSSTLIMDKDVGFALGVTITDKSYQFLEKDFSDRKDKQSEYFNFRNDVAQALIKANRILSEYVDSECVIYLYTESDNETPVAFVYEGVAVSALFREHMVSDYDILISK